MPLALTGLCGTECLSHIEIQVELPRPLFKDKIVPIQSGCPNPMSFGLVRAMGSVPSTTQMPSDPLRTGDQQNEPPRVSRRLIGLS